MKMLAGLLNKQNTKLLCAVLVAYVVVDLSDKFSETKTVCQLL